MKLITEDVKWVNTAAAEEPCQWRLLGARDFVASIHKPYRAPEGETQLQLLIFTEPSQFNDDWWYYDVPMCVGYFDTVEEAMRVCVDKLAEAGLLDPLWWLSQCRDG